MKVGINSLMDTAIELRAARDNEQDGLNDDFKEDTAFIKSKFKAQYGLLYKLARGIDRDSGKGYSFTPKVKEAMDEIRTIYNIAW